MDKKEIEDKIARLKRLIADKSSTPEEIKRYESGVKRYEDILKTIEKSEKEEDKEEEESESAKKEKEEKKASDKKKETKTPEKKESATKKSSKKVIVVDGKEYDENSAEFCELLVTKFKERREKAKEKNAKGKKTVSVMSRIAEHVEKGIATAIKTGIKENEDKINKNPAPYIKKLEKLEVTTKNFLQDLKDVLGDEYDPEEVTETVKALHDLVAKLKSKIKKK